MVRWVIRKKNHCFFLKKLIKDVIKYKQITFLDFQYIDQVCDGDLAEIESLNEVLNLIEHIPNSHASESDFEECDNQATVRFNIVEHTCEMKKLNQSFRGINDFGK